MDFSPHFITSNKGIKMKVETLLAKKIRVLVGIAVMGLVFSFPAYSQSASTGEKKAEVTPTELPGAETFIYRELKPEPVRLFVFKPKEWKKEDKRSALIYFFGGG